MIEINTSETLLVFEGGDRQLAFKALTVKSMTAGELWVGQAPLHLGLLLDAGPGVFERRTRVLELETSDNESVPVLVRGPISIRSVPRSAVRISLTAQTNLGLQQLVESIIDDGAAKTIVIAPDGVQEFVRASSLPPAPNTAQ